MEGWIEIPYLTIHRNTGKHMARVILKSTNLWNLLAYPLLLASGMKNGSYSFNSLEESN
jgi:hypothetical protein